MREKVNTTCLVLAVVLIAVLSGLLYFDRFTTACLVGIVFGVVCIIGQFSEGRFE